MSNILIIGYTTEGPTDRRFLEAIIKKTFEQIAAECESAIETYDPLFIPFQRKHSFVKGLELTATEAFNAGASVLCVHVDAEDSTDNNAFSNKINPAFQNILSQSSKYLCNNLVLLIPIRMSEAWMLADKGLLKEEIGTSLSDQDLDITKNPESIADPKETIKNALRLAQASLPNRRKRIEISEIYQPIGQKISLEELEKLSSYLKFKTEVRNAFVRLNYLPY